MDPNALAANARKAIYLLVYKIFFNYKLQNEFPSFFFKFSSYRISQKKRVIEPDFFASLAYQHRMAKSKQM